MASVSSSTSISQPVDRVFAYVTRPENHTSWNAGILSATVTPDGPLGVGSTYHYTTEVMGRRMETMLQISEYEENRRWSVTTTGVPTPVTTVYTFEDAGGATHLTITMELSGGYPAAAEAMVKAQMEKSLAEQCARIKQMVEK